MKIDNSVRTEILDAPLTTMAQNTLGDAINEIDAKIDQDNFIDFKTNSTKRIQRDRQIKANLVQRIKSILKALVIAREELKAPVKKENIRAVNGKAMQECVRTIIYVLTSTPLPSREIQSKQVNQTYYSELIEQLNPLESDKYNYSNRAIIRLNDELLVASRDGKANNTKTASKRIIFKELNITFNDYLERIGLIDNNCQLTSYGKTLLYSANLASLIHNYFHHQYINYYSNYTYAQIFLPVIKMLRWLFQTPFKYDVGALFAIYLLNDVINSKLKTTRLKDSDNQPFCFDVDANTAMIILLSFFACFVKSTPITTFNFVATVAERVKYINQNVRRMNI